MDKEKIRKNADKIIDEAEDIKEEIEEKKEKRGRILGDSIIDIDF